MAVYVDVLRDWGGKRGMRCRLISDAPPGDNTELHAFAARLGLGREWFQGRESAGVPLYYLTARKKQLAVGLGAVELRDGPFRAICKAWMERAVLMLDAAPTQEATKDVRDLLYS